MKKMILTIVVLLVILVGMIINKNIEKSQEVKIDEVQAIENYIKKIYGWKEVTFDALPEFDNINNASQAWLWGVLRKNIESEEITDEIIQGKVEELFGKEISNDFSLKENEYIKYDNETQKYVFENITLDAIDDEFFINKIEKNKDDYKIQIVEYLVDYTDSENGKIIIKNLNDEVIKETINEENPDILQIVKDNLDRFSKKNITLVKENERLIIKKVER